jgi:nitrate/nitrite transporter NarK
MTETSDRSIGELTRDVSEQTAVLVRKELALATAELKEKGRHAGVGVGLFGGAGVFGFYAVGALIATAILGLAEVVDGWLAALIVTVVLLTVAAGAALIGKREVTQATPPAPEKARESVAVDVETVKEAARR